LLGFRAQVGIDDGLHRLVAWWEQQRALETTSQLAETGRASE
jgi:hypothetical protein